MSGEVHLDGPPAVFVSNGDDPNAHLRRGRGNQADAAPEEDAKPVVGADGTEEIRLYHGRVDDEGRPD
ncbi:hypothetical protein [Haloferax sp. ATB1]|uniref:hypothetical protein n=1 Tax=Haloferax sp. ATB1 TaxID=1508454 RepID=UPI001F527309|nr:hypothetical protein [Haloferax sp. ATB1]